MITILLVKRFLTMSFLKAVKAKALAVMLLVLAILAPAVETKTETKPVATQKGPFIVNTKAYLAMVIGGFITMLVGGALFIFSYVVVNAIIGAAGTFTNAVLNTSMYAGIGTLVTGLQLASLVFVAIGFYMVVSVFIGIGGTAMGRGSE